eukprot:jgi/Mesvir1/26780/Mv20550-RA.3
MSLTASSVSVGAGSVHFPSRTLAIAFGADAIELADRSNARPSASVANECKRALGLGAHLGRFLRKRHSHLVIVRCHASGGAGSEVSPSPPFDWERHHSVTRIATGVASVMLACISGVAFKYAMGNLPRPKPPPPVPAVAPQTTGPSFGQADFKDDATFRRAYAPIPAAGLYRQVWEVPNPRITRNRAGWISDQSRVFTAQDMKHLNAVVNGLKQTHNIEVAIVTLPNLGPKHTPKSFATALFNYWGVGDPVENNGVLLLLVTGPRRLQIEIGSGLDKVMTSDGWLEEMEASVMAPLLAEEECGEAFDRGLAAIGERLESKSRRGDSDAAPTGGGRRRSLRQLVKTYAPLPVGVASAGTALLGLTYATGAWGADPRWPVSLHPRQPAVCSACGSRQRMRWDRRAKLGDLEDAGERQEMLLGSVDYSLLRCTDCGQTHVFGTPRPFAAPEVCPRCGYRTLVSETSRVPGSGTQMLSVVTRRCACCRFSNQSEVREQAYKSITTEWLAQVTVVFFSLTHGTVTG